MEGAVFIFKSNKTWYCINVWHQATRKRNNNSHEYN